MVPDRDVDPSSLYEAERNALLSLLRSLPDEALARKVAATPMWTVRDVLAHLVGITADLNGQRFGDGDGDAWTRAQVTARTGRSVEDLAAEWDHEAPRFEAGLGLFGYGFGAHYLGDLLQHVGDVEATLDRDPVRDDLALAVALDFYLSSLEETLDATEVGAIAVRVDDEAFLLGSGEVVASLVAPRYELFRALGGRRTVAEIAALEWSGDADRVVGLISRYPVPGASLGEARHR